MEQGEAKYADYSLGASTWIMLPMNLKLAMNFVGCISCTMVRGAHPTARFMGLSFGEKIGGCSLSRLLLHGVCHLIFAKEMQ